MCEQRNDVGAFAVFSLMEEQCVVTHRYTILQETEKAWQIINNIKIYYNNIYYIINNILIY
jgi:hypothetical protein